jgi:hypothetical protein
MATDGKLVEVDQPAEPCLGPAAGMRTSSLGNMLTAVGVCMGADDAPDMDA